MKKKMSRGLVIVLYNQMATMAFGHLEEETLEIVMDNFMNLGKEVEHYNKMTSEMGKRLYDGVDKKQIEDYNAMARKATAEEMEAAFPAIFPLVKKQNIVDASLREKQVEVELTPVDRKEFVKGVLKGNPKIATAVFDLFEPMFKAEPKEDAKEDFSELDALMKE